MPTTKSIAFTHIRLQRIDHNKCNGHIDGRISDHSACTNPMGCARYATEGGYISGHSAVILQCCQSKPPIPLAAYAYTETLPRGLLVM
eukprot:1141017-Pelagomonas_calceolata.AAC.3